jgi:hypothetical protein
MFQRLLFEDWRVGAAIRRLNKGQRELHVLRYTLSWQQLASSGRLHRRLLRRHGPHHAMNFSTL